MKSQFVWTKYLLLACLVAVCTAFGYITYWSFFQTMDWFRFLDFEGNDYVSLALASVFQYGQGPVLFLISLFVLQGMNLSAVLKRRTKGTSEYAITEHEIMIAKWSVWGLRAAFIVFATIDAWTNVQQMHTGLDAKTVQGIFVGKDKYFFTSVIGVVLVFVEEGLGVAFSLASHTYNDIRVIHGHKRIEWLDVFSDHARSLMSGGGTQSQRPHQTNNDSHRHGNRTQQTVAHTPMSRASTPIMPTATGSNRPLYNEPTYHPVSRPESGVGFHRPAINVPEEVDLEDEEE